MFIINYNRLTMFLIVNFFKIFTSININVISTHNNDDFKLHRKKKRKHE